MASIGQLAATTPASIIPVGGGTGKPRTLSLLFYNAHASDDQVVEVTLTRGAATARTIFKETLRAKEKFVVSNLQLEDDDLVKAAATAATSVNYVVLPGTPGGFFGAEAIDANGGRKGTTTVAQTFTTIVAATATAIPVTSSGSFPITQAGAETNTLAIPTFLGQQLDIFVDTDTSGARVITASQRINQAANTIITLTEVGDFIRLVAITIAGALRWQVVSNDGAVLS